MSLLLFEKHGRHYTFTICALLRLLAHPKQDRIILLFLHIVLPTDPHVCLVMSNIMYIVKIQTTPGFANTLREAMPKIISEEGVGGLYKGLVPLWLRQIPYTMMKFACFERTVELLYSHVVPKPREQCTKGEQLIVTFAAGYIAGVFCAVVSHPADSVVSKLNQEKGASAGDVLRKLGFAGVWKGLGPRIIMIGTLTAAQWFIYDAVKVWLRMPRPPPPQMPESLKKKAA